MGDAGAVKAPYKITHSLAAAGLRQLPFCLGRVAPTARPAHVPQVDSSVGTLCEAISPPPTPGARIPFSTSAAP